MRIRSLLAFLGLVFFGVMEVRAQFSLTGEFRPRFEYRNGYQKLPDSATDFAAFINQRTRLTVNYKNDKLSTKLSMQEVRVWGNEKFKSEASTVSVYEAWVELKLSDSLKLRMGRQELIYDNERILSNNNWRQSAQVHDAAVLRWTYNGWKIDFGAAFNQREEALFGTSYDNTAPEISGNYKTFNYLWATRSLGQFRLNLTALADGFQKTGTKNTTYLRLTYGGSVSYSLSYLTATMRGYYQTGKTQNGQSISAFYLNPDLAFYVADFTIDPGLEVFSGNDFTDKTNKKYNEFINLYGMGHQFNGHMDYFTNFSRDTKGAGLVDGYLKLTYKLNERTALKADYHYFALENNYLYKEMKIDRYLGSEVDLNCKIDFTKEINLFFGYSFMLADESMEYILGGDSKRMGNWAWVMLTVKPVFFNAGK